MLAAHKTESETQSPVDLKLAVEPGPSAPAPSRFPETHYLLRCHRIALDFGPRAAERALAFFGGGEQRSDVP